MMARRHITRHAAASPRTPYTFLRKSGRSDRSEIACEGPKARMRGLGEIHSKQCVAAQYRLDRPERPEMRPLHARAQQWGVGGMELFHALVGISGRSGRSGRDPPLFSIVFRALGFGCSSEFRTLSELFRTRQTLSFTFEINILLSIQSKQQNLGNRGQA